MAKEYKDLVVGLDIGTSKVMVVVAEVMPGGELKLAGGLVVLGKLAFTLQDVNLHARLVVAGG